MSLYGTTNQVLLCICDGMGFSKNTHKNAVLDANTPTLDSLYRDYPFTTLSPGGISVGLPKGVAGNSEVGHLNMGAGRPVRQDLVRINEAISNNTLKEMDKFKELVSKTSKSNNRIHLLTLLSDGGVHSHIDHLKHIIKILTPLKLDIYLHAFMDGRDTPKTNGIKYIDEIEQLGGFTFASIQGRSIGMDRDRRWEKINVSYNTMIGTGDKTKLNVKDYLQQEYDKNIYDEFITPTLLSDQAAITNHDTIFFLNFRPDRAKEISAAFCDKNFTHFQNPIRPQYFLCMSPYIDEEFPEVPILFNREKVKNTLSGYLSKQGKKQFKIAETEKYAHVTYFFNGGEETPFEGEERMLINSPRDVETYDQKPQMSALEVLDKLLSSLNDKSFSLFIVNFANPDMVGHTGNYLAAISAMETIDHCIKELSSKCLDNGISMLITADHGNCDQMEYPDGSPQTAHSNSDVPFCLVQKELEKSAIQIQNGEYSLKDIAPTVLHLLGIEKHQDMTGQAIFK